MRKPTLKDRITDMLLKARQVDAAKKALNAALSALPEEYKVGFEIATNPKARIIRAMNGYDVTRRHETAARRIGEVAASLMSVPGFNLDEMRKEKV